jgi:hypothetical protein
VFSTAFHLGNTGSGLRWQLTTHTVLPATSCVGVDEGTCPVTEAVPDDLGEMAHELVVVAKLVALDADDRGMRSRARRYGD